MTTLSLKQNYIRKSLNSKKMSLKNQLLMMMKKIIIEKIKKFIGIKLAI
jgi:hypothetical protein